MSCRKLFHLLKLSLRNGTVRMNPITQMRNALGKDQGGSGVELNREEYMKSVEFWKEHAAVI